MSRECEPAFWRRTAALLLGLVFVLFALEGLFRFGGWAYLVLRRPEKSSESEWEDAICCVGDSFMYGLGASSQEGGLPAQLEQILHRRGYQHLRVVNHARPGINSSQCLRRVRQFYARGSRGPLIVLVGLNNYWNLAESRLFSQGNPVEAAWWRSLRLYKLGRILFFRVGLAQDPESSIGAGWEHYHNAEFKRAEQVFRTVLANHEEDQWASIGLGAVLRSERRFTEAAEMFERARELGDTVPDVAMNLGWCYLRNGRYIEARRMFREYLEAGNHEAFGFIGLAWAALEENRLQEARAYFDTASRYDAYSHYIADGLGWLELLDGHYREAAFHFEQVLRAMDNFYWSRIGLGYARLALGDIPGASDSFEQARALGMPFPDADHGLAWIRLMNGEPESAEESFARVKQLDPGFPISSQREAEQIRPQDYIVLARYGHLSLETWLYNSPAEVVLDGLRADLQSMLDICREREVPMTICTYPASVNVGKLERLFRTFSRENGLGLVDFSRPFELLLKEESLDTYFVVDRHPNDRGYRLMAGWAADTLLDQPDFRSWAKAQSAAPGD